MASAHRLKLVGSGGADGECRRQLASRVMQEFGEAFAAYQLADADGDLDATEQEHVGRELEELERAVAKFRAAIKGDA